MSSEQRTISDACPHRCFLSEVKGILNKAESDEDDKTSLRLMGVAVSLVPPPSKETNTPIELILDDGTDVVSITVPISMQKKIQSTQAQIVGMTLECVVSFTSSGRYLIADQIAIIDDLHMETLRWFELSFREKIKKDANNPYSMENGYPSRPVGADDLFELIKTDSSISNSKGIAMEDLARFFQLDSKVADEFLEELQFSGQIYRNEHGLYLPL